jgi:hypothetical protein
MLKKKLLELTGGNKKHLCGLVGEIFSGERWENIIMTERTELFGSMLHSA